MGYLSGFNWSADNSQSPTIGNGHNRAGTNEVVTVIQTTAMRILICDDQAIAREGLALLLNLERDIEVVGTAEDGAQAIELTARLLPDLVLMDLKSHL